MSSSKIGGRKAGALAFEDEDLLQQIEAEHIEVEQLDREHSDDEVEMDRVLAEVEGGPSKACSSQDAKQHCGQHLSPTAVTEAPAESEAPLGSCAASEADPQESDQMCTEAVNRRSPSSAAPPTGTASTLAKLAVARLEAAAATVGGDEAEMRAALVSGRRSCEALSAASTGKPNLEEAKQLLVSALHEVEQALERCGTEGVIADQAAQPHGQVAREMAWKELNYAARLEPLDVDRLQAALEVAVHAGVPATEEAFQLARRGLERDEAKTAALEWLRACTEVSKELAMTDVESVKAARDRLSEGLAVAISVGLEETMPDMLEADFMRNQLMGTLKNLSGKP